MIERAQAASDFLDANGCARWQREPLHGDASARAYERIRLDGRSLILMIAPVSSAPQVRRFVEIARLLTANGFCAPKIEAADPATGLVLMEDLGADSVAHWLRRNPGDELAIYREAADLLAKVRALEPELQLEQIDARRGAEMIEPVFEWYLGETLPELSCEIERALGAYALETKTLALRDFHAENLIWRPERTGHERFGLLDFQDALVAPSGYDLCSLIRDARRDVDADAAAGALEIFATAAGIDRQCLKIGCAILGVQRNLRILGVFSRLALRDGKRGYLDLIPRVRACLDLDLAHPELAPIASILRAHFPRPERARGWRA